MRLFFLFAAMVGMVAGAVAPARAQSGGLTTTHGTISWGGYTEVPSRNARKQKVPTFSEASHGLDEQVGWYTLRLAGGAVSQGELVNLVYQPFSPADAKMFDVSKMPAGPDPRLNTGTEMKLPVTRLSLRPARRNPQTGQPERLVSFDYQYVPEGKNTASRSTGFHTYANHSVLQTGDWYKIGVGESGIYKLDKAALVDLGLNTQTLNPSNLHIYGNSMGILPQASMVRRPDDLAENNIMFFDRNSNSRFDDDDYFFFYSPGPHTWEARDGVFRHRNNIYTDTAYYFVTVNNTPGRRVAAAAAPSAGATPANITTFTYRDFWEHDLVNLMHSGRTWLGEGFRASGAAQSFAFSSIPDLVANVPVKVTSSLVASSFSPSSFQLTLNELALGTERIDQLSTIPFSGIANQKISTWQLPLANPGTELRVGLTYSSADASASAYLDYLEINAQRQLRLSDAQLEFRTLSNIGPNALNQYTLANSSGAVVWDVTNPRRPASYALSNGSFVAPADTLREFVAFVPTGNLTKKPRKFGRVPNQDLHAIAAADLIVVTYPVFLGEAQRLANYRQTHDNLQAVVVTTAQIYNEYGSGGQDVTAIRDFVKQIYDRSPAGKQMELLLFGDASYDYKSDPYNPDKTDINFWPPWWRNRVPFRNDSDFDKFNQNYVPTYQSRESFEPFYAGKSYASDDYYVLLDDDEGEWVEGNSNELLDMGVGRLPVRQPKDKLTDVAQARQVVDKIISYDSPQSYGKWRNRITLVSDDGEGDLFVGPGSEVVADTLQAKYPVYNVHKVYLDLYPQVALSAGQRSPDCERAINQSIEQGSLIVNYLGHGGPKGWADEQILTDASVTLLQNPNNLTFFTTGTCDFSYFDNPDFTSAGEKALTDNATGGAVGLFTTTRVVDALQNAGLNQKYFNRVLRPVNGKIPSIGTIVMMSKNDYHGAGAFDDRNSRNYTLLADPSMTLAYPQQTVVLDSVQHWVRGRWRPADTLQALGRVRVQGSVLNKGALNTGFTGRAQVTIYDKPATVMTLGDEQASNTADAPRPVVVQESVIYGGQANVVNGKFNLTFVVPKDINYRVGLGKASLYAYDPTRRVDAHGFELNQVGGAAHGAPTDTTPPEIKLYMDSESFAFGGLTAPNTTLLAFLSDSSGINTTGAGVGHDITATIDNDQSKQLVLNDSYVSNVGDFRAGKVTNLFKGLANGPHSLRLKAWDTYNNSAEKEIEFVVAVDEKMALDHVLNYPNPFANTTTFMFDHNQAGGADGMLDVQVQIFTVTGRLVRTLTASLPSSKSHQDGITWNGRDEFNDQLARGVYVYRLSVRSANNGTASKYEKLVILN